jgi:hypothetical protein
MLIGLNGAATASERLSPVFRVDGTAKADDNTGLPCQTHDPTLSVTAAAGLTRPLFAFE